METHRNQGKSDGEREHLSNSQVLLRVQRGSRQLRGSSPCGGPCKPCPSWGWRKLCLLIRCFPRHAASSVKASGVREASRSRDEEVEVGGGEAVPEGSKAGAAWWLDVGDAGEGSTKPLPWLAGGEGDWALAGEEEEEETEGGGLKEEGWGSLGKGTCGALLGGSGASWKERSAGAEGHRSRLDSGSESLALCGRMLSLAMVAWMELMGRSPPRTMSCASCLEYGWLRERDHFKCFHH